MQILKQTRHPPPLVVQPCTVLVPLLPLLVPLLLLIVLSSALIHHLLPPQALLVLKIECKEVSKFILENGMKINRLPRLSESR
jgi:hypothetical protein